MDTPIADELNLILDTPIPQDVILIDDARMFGNDPAYPSIGDVQTLICAKNMKLDIRLDIILLLVPS